MPVFAQICSANPVADQTAVLAACTCGDELCMDTDDVIGKDNNASFIHPDGVCHLPTCALYASAFSSLNGKNALSQLKQQQTQLKLVGGLALLRKPPVSTIPRRHDPFAPVRLQPSRSCHLYPGSQFKGEQISGSSNYVVMVDIKDVNLRGSSLCGYLHINGLTKEYPKLTTFFDAEIVGPDYSFVTEKWDATVSTDKEHWNKFSPFAPMIDTFGDKEIKYDFHNKDVIFMRWKEHFLVPDHRVQGISGASFAGFYYICYNKITGEIDGYYFHRSSEKFQRLMLKHVADRPSSLGSFEFR
ncbi:hypothetical protein BX616_007194 [Lobosporangium transversale]|uniref:Vacuolar import and degradation protein-domain-containing protein n=1 Tax=Lobosporangium transversale TaxID=64571 RepID=A0A1Y2GGA4_9FUNG|nr:vacuolar import and degradation protein-domain-containing protein [Lobosporangium transversale]KAF9896568.1 hypothetical protein BX616_007194 [Lobosporangium transversale]ORZ09033.1 vacuolar import and degradation protein-domain-containing protein [Lobosporangium transversale]|eukprot:XP_021878660.1 vacuolar import and degradation protein-domain-containing protein [Lobosporangium transversale]